MRKCQVRHLGRLAYQPAFELQRELVDQRKRGLIPDQLLFVEHPHVITLGRNGRLDNLLAGEEVLRRAGIEFHYTDRGGDITYHGPGQVVCYPILDLREWRRDVVAYVRALEQAIIDMLAAFGIQAGRLAGATGVWVEGKKIAAIGVHISRWVTSHGFALNVDVDLRYFQYIVPCGLAKPVTSLREQGAAATRESVCAVLAEQLASQFGFELEDAVEPALAAERSL
ncbi:MAG: lipoyl(octanoyl) transferase LipB [Acidobacteria bacterium]|nr:lipoyl(octanoyl) transferase LipB [Acidobacteriota bacterium]